MPPLINLDLTTVNANAYMLLAAFRRAARKEGWENDEIDAVTAEATSQGYNHLVNTLSKYCYPSDPNE